MCSWCTVDFIFAIAVVKEIGLSFLVHESRKQHSTSGGNDTGSVLEDEKHFHATLPHSRSDLSELTTSPIKTDVSLSDIGTNAFGRDRSIRSTVVFGLVNVLSETLSLRNWDGAYREYNSSSSQLIGGRLGSLPVSSRDEVVCGNVARFF